jgi:protein-disulfide isomerase
MLRIGVLVAVLMAGAAFPAAAQTLNDAQKEEVRRVVRDYLVSNPEVLDEALIALDRKKAAERRKIMETDARDFSLGPRQARVTIVELFDYQCGYCHAAMDWVFEAVRRNPRDVRVVFKEFPVLGPESVEASQAAIAAMRQGRYAQFHRALMGHRGQVDSTTIDRLARGAGVDVARMRRDMNEPAILDHLQRNHELAAESDIRGTPAFMINGEFIRGYDKAEMDKLLAKALRETKKTRAAG